MMPLNARVSLEAQRIMQDAFDDLEKTISVGDRAQMRDTTLDDVRQAAYQIEQQLAARQSLRNMRRLVPLFTGLEYYSRTIEALCNGTPFLPWIWAPVKLVLKVSADFVNAFERIIKAYARIAEPLARFKTYDSAFSKDKEIQLAVAIFYSDILRFHKEAYKFVRRGSWQLLFATSWGRFQRQFDNIFDDLKAHEELIDKTVNSINISEAKEMRERLQRWRQEELDNLAKKEEEVTASQYLAIITLLRFDESHQLKAFDTIAAEAEDNPGTCAWALNQPRIRSWARCSQDTKFLVLHGHPGSGKSVLTTQIAKFLRASEQSLVISHFCTYMHAESTDYDHILRSLLIQLIRSDPELIAHVHDWLILRKKAPSSSVLEQLLRLLVGAIATTPSKTSFVHLVVDGLDECVDSTQTKVIQLLDRLITAASGSAVCKALLSTRLSNVISKAVKRKHQVSLADEKENLDTAIRLYTSAKLGTLQSRFSQMSITDEDVDEMQIRIVQKADGMILWAKLVMEFLAKQMFYSRDEVLKAASVLPRELSQFYGRILTQAMSNFDERSASRMRSILGWIAFTKRPLRCAELLSALSYGSGNEGADELIPSFVLDMCAPLVEKRKDMTYVFIHVSVRSFLQTSDCPLVMTETAAVQEHALAAVRCLLSGSQVFAPSYPEHERILRVLRGLHGFHIYATEIWADYLVSMSAIELEHDLLVDSEFLTLSCKLAEALGYTADAPADTDREDDNSLLDGRMVIIPGGHRGLRHLTQLILLEQQKKTLESDTVCEGTNMIEANDLHSLKVNYQRTIRTILDFRNHPNVTIKELEWFKQRCRTAAFTCQLWSCPHAIFGFETYNLLASHESNHRQHVCVFPGCPYPAFASAKLLKSHISTYHEQKTSQIGRNSIRRRHNRTQIPPTSGAETTLGDHRHQPNEETQQLTSAIALNSISTLDPSEQGGMGQGGMQFEDQLFNQGIQRPNNPAYNIMPAIMTPEPRKVLSSLPPEQRARYEQILKLQMADRGQQVAALVQQQQGGNEALNRLKQFSQEEQRNFSQEVMTEISMSWQEHSETATKLQRIAGDMSKVSRGLTKWYSLTQDDTRAKIFFRTRSRILSQFSDGEQMQVLKDKFSIRASEIDQARAMLESMAKDLAASIRKSGSTLKQYRKPRELNRRRAIASIPIPASDADLTIASAD